MKKFQFRSVVAMANSKLSVKYAAILLSFSTLISALLGIFRDRLLNSYYLDTYPTGIDAYTAAFTIPDFMFFVLTSGALAVSFYPVFNQRLVLVIKNPPGNSALQFSISMAIVTLISSILIMIFADPLVRYIVGPGLDESGTTLAINMMRVIAINPFLFSIRHRLKPPSSRPSVVSSSTPLLQLSIMSVFLSALLSSRMALIFLASNFLKVALWVSPLV